jgi:predicted nucleic acid-binding OB-fold protein
MKIKTAIKKATKINRKISSRCMREQTAKSLIYWLFVYPKTKTQARKQFEELLTYTDWSLD